MAKTKTRYRSPEDEADDVDRRALSIDYFLFILRFWEVIEPETVLVENWHIEYLAKILQDEVERIAAKKPKTGDIVINIPPRAMKSYIVTIMLNAWAWTRYPWIKIISTSYNASLAADHAMKTRRIIQSPLYQRLWGHVFKLRMDQDTKTWFENDKGGVRRTAGTGGGITGAGADILIADDPINPVDMGEASLDAAIRWWDSVAYSRLNDQAVGLRVVIMQRLHERDLSGHLSDRAKGSKTKRPLRRFVIPADDSFAVEPADLKKYYRDGLFWPDRFTDETLADYKLTLGSTGYANQMGQSPMPADGIIFKKEWFRRYDPETINFTGANWRTIQSWDLTFKESDDGALNAGQTWTYSGAKYYLRPGAVARKMEYTKQREAIKSMRAEYPMTNGVLIEDAANAQAILSDLKAIIPGLIVLQKRTGKVEAAQAVAPLFEAGNVFVPIGTDGDDFIASLISFPRGRFKDPIDACTLFLNWARKNVSRATIAEIGRRSGDENSNDPDHSVSGMEF